MKSEKRSKTATAKAVPPAPPAHVFTPEHIQASIEAQLEGFVAEVDRAKYRRQMNEWATAHPGEIPVLRWHNVRPDPTTRPGQYDDGVLASVPYVEGNAPPLVKGRQPLTDAVLPFVNLAEVPEWCKAMIQHVKTAEPQVDWTRVERLEIVDEVEPVSGWKRPRRAVPVAYYANSLAEQWKRFLDNVSLHQGQRVLLGSMVRYAFVLGGAVERWETDLYRRDVARGRTMKPTGGDKQKKGGATKVERRAAFAQAMKRLHPHDKKQKYTDGYLPDLAKWCATACANDKKALTWCCRIGTFKAAKVGQYLKLPLPPELVDQAAKIIAGS